MSLQSFVRRLSEAPPAEAEGLHPVNGEEAFDIDQDLFLPVKRQGRLIHKGDPAEWKTGFIRHSPSAVVSNYDPI